MPKTLERIRVSGFKSIRELDLELNALNILVGANGSGKSNFIALFQLLNAILEEHLQVYSAKVGVDALLYYGRETTSQIEIELTFAAGRYKARLVPSNEGTLIFGLEDFSTSISVDGLVFEYPMGHKETKLPNLARSPFDIRPAMESWKIYHFHDTSDSSPMKRIQNLHDNLRLHPDASNIAAFLYLLQEKHPKHYELIKHTIRQVAPFFDDFVLRPSPLNEENILLQWRAVNRDNLFNAHILSDGTLRFICLVTLLFQPKLPSIILIDEPELGLHPSAINILAGLLKSAAAQTQVIVSTQSVPLINQFSDLQDIIVVERRQGQSVFKRLDASILRDWMREYGIGDLWEKNVIGGRPQPESA